MPAALYSSPQILEIPMTALVIFDGVCNLCVGSVKFILRYEAGPDLQFAAVQSALGSRMASEHGFDPTDVKTFILIEDGKAYFRSDAAIHVALYLRRPWRWLAAVRFVPRCVRDWGYNLVAANRYRWFGRTDSCMVPTPELRRRFIED